MSTKHLLLFNLATVPAGAYEQFGVSSKKEEDLLHELLCLCFYEDSDEARDFLKVYVTEISGQEEVTHE